MLSSSRSLLFSSTLLCRFEVQNVRQKIMLERRRKELETKQRISLPLQPSDDELAQQLGFVAPTVVDIAGLKSQRDRVSEMAEDQRQRRVAKREAFVAWQAGQREKGAAHRLSRQAKTAERTKRAHCQSQTHRLISTALVDPDGTNSNNAMDEELGRYFSGPYGEGRRTVVHRSTTDMLNRSASSRGGALFLKLSRGGN